ncbi:hypothetical protein EON63_01580 [archaeon]|nr:MAG: hypothetical protein EON63_01580 [archaeon]
MSEQLVDIFKMAQISASEPPITGKESFEQSVPETGMADASHTGKDMSADMIAYHEMMADYEANDTRIAMIGNVDSGKSTLIGVLTNNALDDGRGAAR